MIKPVYCSIGLVYLLIACLAHSHVYGQSLDNKVATVSGIRLSLDSERVKVLYDVSGITSRDSIYLQVESRTRGLLNASTVTGDVGKGVLPGKNKVIYWDYRLDGLTIDDAIRATVLVKQPPKPAQQKAIGGGPANALISVLAPGVGTIFVQPNHRIGLRPLITGAYVGLLVYGFWQNSRSKQQYDLYASQLNESDYTEANRLHHNYLVATRLALALLITDVAYTFLKGRKNVRQKQGTSQRVVFNYVGNSPTIGVQVHF
ncbi:hypothetical protein G8759_28435 [Spirosoma aureum]|uniref:DUF5683 domain-containing protein n=1 Tax=Spirosoma aureum TaxID=2692134 RepID=A0A6G9AV59_9BACT|nr:hypothetical protein [Spirosoma aureum]QIP16290.1 hypothetical protein G8759_28435 [Spirosoma aureum]